VIIQENNLIVTVAYSQGRSIMLCVHYLTVSVLILSPACKNM